jgi:hypothetical protein
VADGRLQHPGGSALELVGRRHDSRVSVAKAGQEQPPADGQLTACRPV